MVSTYERVGGRDAVALMVDDFYRRVLDDPEVAPYFDGIDLARLKSHQRSFIAAAIGGSEPYQGRGMSGAHAGLNITDDHFDLVVGHLVDALSGLDVDSETIEQVAAKLEPLRGEIVQA